MISHKPSRLAAALLAGVLSTALASGAHAATRTENLGVFGGAVAGAAVGGPVGMLVGAAVGGHYGHQRQRAHDGETDAARLGAALARSEDRADEAEREVANLEARVAHMSAELSAGRARIDALLDEQALLAQLQFNVLFATDEHALSDADKARLVTLGKLLKNQPALRVRLSGHADPRGSDAHNDALSMRRAQSAAEVLEGADVTPEQIETVAFGERQARADENDRDALARERRVGIELLRPAPARGEVAQVPPEQ